MSKTVNTALAARAQSGDQRAIHDLIVTNVRLVSYVVRRYIAQHPDAAHLREELVAEGLLGLTVAANRLAKERPDPTAFLAKTVKGFVQKLGGTKPTGYSQRTMKRRAADGIEDFPPDIGHLNEHVVSTDQIVDPTALTDLRDCIDHACADETDRGIVRLLELEQTTKQCAEQLAISVSEVKRRRRNIKKRYDAQ